MEDHLVASSSLSTRDEDIVSMMSGDGGSQVDLILYLIDQGKIGGRSHKHEPGNQQLTPFRT